jgi:hypothetical protein
MVSPIQAANLAAHAGSRSVRGESVTYAAGATSFTVTAVRAQTTWEPRPSNIDGVLIEERSTDWIIDLVDLTDNSITAPVAGHTITDENGVVYRLLPFGGNELVYRYHDRARTVVRCFSKER